MGWVGGGGGGGGGGGISFERKLVCVHQNCSLLASAQTLLNLLARF